MGDPTENTFSSVIVLNGTFILMLGFILREVRLRRINKKNGTLTSTQRNGSSLLVILPTVAFFFGLCIPVTLLHFAPCIGGFNGLVSTLSMGSSTSALVLYVVGAVVVYRAPPRKCKSCGVRAWGMPKFCSECGVAEPRTLGMDVEAATEEKEEGREERFVDVVEKD